MWRFERLSGQTLRACWASQKSRNMLYISSATLSAPAAADAVRGHWVLDVTFKDDLSRVRTGHGAKNMAVVRHFAFNLVRAISDKRPLKTRRKRAAWDPSYLASILNMNIP